MVSVLTVEAETVLFVKESNLYHLIRAVRENVKSFTEQLNKGYYIRREDVALVIGNDEALKLLGIFTGVDTKHLSKWIHSGVDWVTIQADEGVVSNAL